MKASAGIEPTILAPFWEISITSQGPSTNPKPLSEYSDVYFLCFANILPLSSQIWVTFKWITRLHHDTETQDSSSLLIFCLPMLSSSSSPNFPPLAPYSGHDLFICQTVWRALLCHTKFSTHQQRECQKAPSIFLQPGCTGSLLRTSRSALCRKKCCASWSGIR